MSAAKPRYEVLWTETARTDVEEIARFIAHDSVENALAVLARLEHAEENLAVLPERGRFVPELACSRTERSSSDLGASSTGLM